MKPLTDVRSEELENIHYVLADIDDTLTEEGKLLPEAYSALWRLSEAGFSVIPVTGRPAGWCDMIIRQWPVKAVVGENGAFVYYYDENAEAGERPYRSYLHPSVAGEEIRARLSEVEEEVFRRVPEVRRAKDQPFRLFDLAIDFREDVPKLGLDVAERVAEVCREMGAEAKISSIHVNTWFGEYDKLDTALRFLEEIGGVNKETARKEVLFCGDSPNDEPMFSYFPLSCGVANVRDYEGLMSVYPSYITSKPYGRGFAEIVEKLISVSFTTLSQ